MITDIRFAFRQFAKTPGVTAAVILSLALGIAANTTVLCWLERFVWRPLTGVERQQEFVVVVSNQGSGCVSLPDLRDLTRNDTVFAGAFAAMPTSACLTVDQHASWIEAQIVTANFFDVLRVRPILGRTFLANEDKTPGGNPVVVISERLWRSQFGARKDIIGTVIDLNRRMFTILGVAPASFDGSVPPGRFDLWAPASMIWEVRNQDKYFLTRRTARGWHNLVRLQPDVSIEQARSVVSTTNAHLKTTYPNENTDVTHRVVPLTECPWGGQAMLAAPLRLLLFVSIGVQLIVTANVANLLLARAVDRRREVAIRLAAGASRLRIVRQFLTESVVLAMLGGLLGVLVASWTIDLFQLSVPAELRTLSTLVIPMNGTTLALVVALTVLIGVLFGLVPALQATRPDVSGALREGGRGTRGGASQRLRRSLVVVEVALALVLLVAAALCAKGMRQARQIDIGFEPKNVLLAHLQIGMNGYDPTTGKGFYRELRRRLSTEAGVEEAALASWFPLGLSGCKGSNVYVEGRDRRPGENPTHEFAVISPRYFATMQIPLVSGRDFTDADDASAPTVAIVNEHFAQRFWPGQEAVGRRFRSGGVWRTIVGVAKAGKYNRLDEEAWCFFYLPYQQGVPDLDLAVCVRTRADPAGFATTVRHAIHDVDPGVEVLRTVSLQAHSSMAFLVPRFVSTLLSLLGVVALILAAMGVYGVISYTVSQRTQELGVRLALGAQPRHLLLAVIGQGVLLGLAGVSAGVVLALSLTSLMRAFLYGISPFDPVAFALTSIVLLIITALACYVPARRAMQVNPMEALRAE